MASFEKRGAASVFVIFFIAILRKCFVNVKTLGKINIGQKTNKDDSGGNGVTE